VYGGSGLWRVGFFQPILRLVGAILAHVGDPPLRLAIWWVESWPVEVNIAFTLDVGSPRTLGYLTMGYI
jgi:hypothetical protein